MVPGYTSLEQEQASFFWDKFRGLRTSRGGAGKAHSLLGLRVSAAGSYFSVLPLVPMNLAINAYI